MAKKTLLASVIEDFFTDMYVGDLYRSKAANANGSAALAKRLAAIARKNHKDTSKAYTTYTTGEKSHSKRIRLNFQVENAKDKVREIEVFDNDIAAFFERIICGSRIQNETKVLLFCHCFAELLSADEKQLEAFRSAMRNHGVTPTISIERDIYQCYQDGVFKPAPAEKRSSGASGNFVSQFWDRDKLSTWRFYAGFKQAESKSGNKTSFSDRNRIAKTIIEEARKHPVFEMLLESEDKALYYKQEILSMLKLCTVYDSKLAASDKDPYSGIIVLSPLNAFYTHFKTEVRSYFRYSEGQYNVYSLGLVVGAFAKSAKDNKHTFKLDRANLKLKGDSEYYTDAREDFDAIVKDIKNGKIKCINCVGGDEYAFVVSQHRFYFEAYHDYIRYCAKELNDTDLKGIIETKALSSLDEKKAHLDRKYTELICYSFFLLSFLGPGCNAVLDQLKPLAGSFSVQGDTRHKQIAILQLFSCLLAESFPITRGNAKKLLQLSYGRAAYPYQLLVLRGFEDFAPGYFNMLQEGVVESLKIGEDPRYPVQEPNYMLIACKLKIRGRIAKISDKEQYGGEAALNFFCDCVDIHDKTWPTVKDSRFKAIYEIVGKIIDHLKKLKDLLGDCVMDKTTPAPAYVYGGNLLLFSLANVLRCKGDGEVMPDVKKLLDNEEDYFESVIYIDYFTRKISINYNADWGDGESKKPFHLLCGGFRVVCAFEFNKNMMQIKDKGDMMADYKVWIEKEKKIGTSKGAQRYWLLLTRLLSYTDFFCKYPECKPVFYDDEHYDCKNTEMLAYDNIPSFTPGNETKSQAFLASPRKLVFTEQSKPNAKY